MKSTDRQTWEKDTTKGAKDQRKKKGKGRKNDFLIRENV
jgi:hypothetical protein